MTKNYGFVIFIVLIIVAIFLVNKGIIKLPSQAILPTTGYNGDMENWCISTTGLSDWEYGFLNGGTTKCSDSNSVGINGLYDGTNNMNEIPLLWELHYGCCIKRSTDFHSGTYSAQIHKQSQDDWYGFGQGQKFAIPVVGGKIYTMNLFYKLAVTSSENRFVFNMKFMDANGIDIDAATQTKNFNVVSVYSPFSISTTAPFNAVKMYWEIWVAQSAVGDLYLDDLTIDETGCTQGATMNCGTDVGACSYGTQTCGASGVWGSCIGAVVPTTETCGDSIDNDCDGPVDEGCTFTALTRAQYIAKFDEIDFATYENTGLSSKNSVGWWAWDNAPIVEAQINMYIATNDQKYIDYAVANTDTIISKATDFDNNGLLDWEATESPVDPILTYGRNLLPIVKLAYVIKKNNIAQYVTKANSYVSFVENNFIPIYDSIWRECGNMGFWVEGTSSAPNNRAAFVGRTHLYLYLITGNQKYLDRSTKYANKIKSTLLLRTDGPTGAPYYFWNYANKAGCTTVGSTYQCTTSCATEGQNICNINPDDWVCSGPVELHYGYDPPLMVEYYEAGIVFTSTDVQRLANSFKEGYLVETAEVDGVPTPVLRWKGEPEGPRTNENGYYSEAGTAHHWAMLGHYDAKVKDVFEKINKWILDDAAVEGNFYNHAYVCVRDTRGTFGATCITPSSPSYDNNLRSSPAYQMSRIGWQLTTATTLSPLVTAPPPVVCGDGILGTGEICDSNNLNSQTCISQGFIGGTLSCSSNCLSFNTNSCIITNCGNGIVDNGEVCDGSNLNSKTCQNVGYSGGTLACSSDCTSFNTNSCTTGSVVVCGNGVVESGEVCDTTNLNGQNCVTQGYDLGSLYCSTDCKSFIQTSCKDSTCGNSAIDSGEVCDGSNLNSKTCQSVGYTSGTLSCANDCQSFNTNSCTTGGALCGNAQIELGEVCDLGALSGSSCVSLGYSSGTLGCASNCLSYLTTGCVMSQSCTSNWQCGAYGSCVNGQQSRSCYDASNCPTPNNQPQLITSCQSSTTSVPNLFTFASGLNTNLILIVVGVIIFLLFISALGRK